MTHDVPTNNPAFSDRSILVALTTMARFLKTKHPGLSPYLIGSLENAREVGLSESDLAALRLIEKAVSRH